MTLLLLISFFIQPHNALYSYIIQTIIQFGFVFGFFFKDSVGPPSHIFCKIFQSVPMRENLRCTWDR